MNIENDRDGEVDYVPVEGPQAVAARVRAAWMKFRELGEILCTLGASFEDERCCV